MKKTGRLATRLLLAIAVVLALSLATFSLFLDAAFRRSLRDQFDARLAQDARAVASMVEYHGYEIWEFESGPLLGFEAGERGAYFQVWTDDGRTVGRSPSLGERAFTRADLSSGAHWGALPDGSRGRLLRAELAPRAEPGVELLGRRVAVVVARSTEELEGAMKRIRALLWGSALTALVLSTLAGAVAVRHGLSPVTALAERVDAIDARRLDERLPVEKLPEELRPAVEKLNELLERLEGAFERERRFGADASHELRTPLAGLRSILEVARSRERPAEDYRRAIDEALDVSRQLGVLVESLLALARLDAGRELPAREAVDLAELVKECEDACADAARRRGLRFDNRVPEHASVASDRERLRVIVQNLVSNAVAYTEENGTVVVASEPARGVLLEVRDSGPSIPEEALERIFDRFYRLDPSRSSNGSHCGIGLALSRALGETLGLTLSASNDPDGWTAFRLRTGAAPSPE